jgi:putative transposase
VCGIPPALLEEASYPIKKELKESNNQGWTTKQVEELIVKKSGINYHHIHPHIPSHPLKIGI